MLHIAYDTSISILSSTKLLQELDTFFPIKTYIMLPVTFRIDFKVLLVYESFHETGTIWTLTHFWIFYQHVLLF